jgi:hypothetical protein
LFAYGETHQPKFQQNAVRYSVELFPYHVAEQGLDAYKPILAAALSVNEELLAQCKQNAKAMQTAGVTLNQTAEHFVKLREIHICLLLSRGKLSEAREQLRQAHKMIRAVPGLDSAPMDRVQGLFVCSNCLSYHWIVFIFRTIGSC